MGRECCIRGCQSKSNKESQVSFHRFPMNLNRRKLWLDAIAKPNYEPGKNSVVCSKHFASNEYIPVAEGKRAMLKDTACPSLFLVAVEGKRRHRKKKIQIPRVIGKKVIHPLLPKIDQAIPSPPEICKPFRRINILRKPSFRPMASGSIAESSVNNSSGMSVLHNPTASESIAESTLNNSCSASVPHSPTISESITESIVNNGYSTSAPHSAITYESIAESTENNGSSTSVSHSSMAAGSSAEILPSSSRVHKCCCCLSCEEEISKLKKKTEELKNLVLRLQKNASETSSETSSLDNSSKTMNICELDHRYSSTPRTLKRKLHKSLTENKQLHKRSKVMSDKLRRTQLKVSEMKTILETLKEKDCHT